MRLNIGADRSTNFRQMAAFTQMRGPSTQGEIEMTLSRMSAATVLAAVLAATPALADKGGVPNGGDGSGNPNAAQPATPANPGEPGDGAQPATPAQPAPKQDEPKKAKKAHPAHPAKPKQAKRPKKAHPEHPAKPGKPATSEAPPADNPHAKAGKTTICHSTGSDTNPYVTITVSDNALKAHARHHDGRDIIPAPAGGCPAPAEQAQQHEQEQPATAPAGEQSTPPSGDAPASTQAEGTEGVATPRGIFGAANSVPAVIGVLGASATSPADAPASSDAVLPAAEATATRGVAGLPFTGMDLALMLIVGLGLVLAGIALRRSIRGRQLTL
jgi:hypothetical protein